MQPVHALSSLMLQFTNFCSEKLYSLTKPVRTIGSKVRDISIKTSEIGKGAIEKIHDYFLPESPSPFNDQVGLSHKYPGIRIIYVNGIHNTKDHCQDAAQRISQVFDGTIVHYTCIPTKGTVRDIASATNSLLSPKKTAASQTLLDNIKDCLKAGQKVGIIAHSAGALAVEQAHRELTDEERSRIHVYAIGPAIALSKEIGRRVKNYVSVKDPIPTIGRFIRGHIWSHPEQVHTVGVGKPSGIIEAHYFTGNHYQGILPEIKKLLLEDLQTIPSLASC